jgi:hypothetical protein
MSQGHWRRLKPNQEGEGRFGEDTQGKTWVDRKETKSTLKAKEKGLVPSPKFVGKKGEFFAFAVPGGRYMFVVHQSQAKLFAELTSEKGWQNSKKTKAFMQAAESKGLFGIFKTDEAVIGYQ